MPQPLKVYLDNHLMGLLIQDEYGDIAFQYDESWLAEPDAVALSQSLPLRRERFSHRECRGFFGGILPEGKIREVIARILGISAKNDVAMLEQIGGECAGAVTFIPDGDIFPTSNDNYQRLTRQELVSILRDLPRCPLLTGMDHVRLSLAGAQDKLAVYVSDGQISIPLDGSPSSHILKPSLGPYKGMVVNEFLCMRLAKAIGLQTVAVEMDSAAEIDYLLIERYDRIRTPSQSLQRLHQEDFCQALGIISQNKYQNEGGPSLPQCFQLLRKASSVPAKDIIRLLDAVIYNYLIGNNDAHGKNFSLLYRSNAEQHWTVELAPLYDLVCTAYYSDLSQKMAMKIGGEYEAERIFPRHFERLAEEAELSKTMVSRRIPSMAEKIKAKLAEVAPDHPVGREVAELIHNRCDQMLQRFRS